MPRIFHPSTLKIQSTIQLSDDAFNHVVHVLRMKIGDRLTLFDGSNCIFNARLIKVDKKRAVVFVEEKQHCDRESPVAIHLGQPILKGRKMDFVIQKSVELGVTSITPLFSERCSVRITQNFLDKRVLQWQKIVFSACEQCGRNKCPVVKTALNLTEWCILADDGLKINLYPGAQNSISTLSFHGNRIHLLVGCEGGLSGSEIDVARTHGFIDVSLGPRILRAETAALSAITLLQNRFGDLS